MRQHEGAMEREQVSEIERAEALRVQQKAADMEELLREREEMEQAKSMGLDYETGKPIREEPIVVDPKTGAHSKLQSRWDMPPSSSKATLVEQSSHVTHTER